MHLHRLVLAACLSAFLVSCLTVKVKGQTARQFANVSPTLEIEVLDPGVDSTGNPAVLVKNGLVEIPPVVMVHRYYYSGDRSFQGPMFPGGPSILVLDHPKTGERLYVPAQMMPGAPRVTYTKHGISYQYPKHRIQLKFGVTGEPYVKYQSGLNAAEKAKNLLMVDRLKTQLDKAKLDTQKRMERSKIIALGVTADVVEGAEIASRPLRHLGKFLPFGAAILSEDKDVYFAERAAEFKRRKSINHAIRDNRLDDVTTPTLR